MGNLTNQLVESMNQPNPNAPTKFSHRNYQTKTYQLKPAKHNLHSELLIGFKLSGRQKNFSPGSVVQLAVLISNALMVLLPWSYNQHWKAMSCFGGYSMTNNQQRDSASYIVTFKYHQDRQDHKRSSEIIQ